MRRCLGILAAAIVLVLLLGIGISASDELSIEVIGDQQVAATVFAVRVRNNGTRRLTYCITTCGKIVDVDTSHEVPAFTVQKRVRKRWEIEMLRCDPDSTVVSRIIHPGEVKQFKIKLAEPGRYRLRLPYKEVSVEGVGAHCEAIDDLKSVKHAESDEFDVIAKPQ
jgi:uncharacterized cupredoxin-like copper-binding protein